MTSRLVVKCVTRGEGSRLLVKARLGKFWLALAFKEVINMNKFSRGPSDSKLLDFEILEYLMFFL
jgi:hypothetical protein